jgi:hypothetical protein
MSTLHVIETKPEICRRVRLSERAPPVSLGAHNWASSGTRYPKKSDVKEGQELYNRRVFYRGLGIRTRRGSPIDLTKRTELRRIPQIARLGND